MYWRKLTLMWEQLEVRLMVLQEGLTERRAMHLMVLTGQRGIRLMALQEGLTERRAIHLTVLQAELTERRAIHLTVLQAELTEPRAIRLMELVVIPIHKRVGLLVTIRPITSDKSTSRD